MTDIEALRARMREAAVAVENAPPTPRDPVFSDPQLEAMELFRALASPANVKALDAEITRLREDMDRVTRERDDAIREVARLVKAREDAHGQWRSLAAERAVETSALKAALAKRDEEVAAIRGDAHFLLDLLMTHAPKRIIDHEEVVKVRLKIHGPEALTKEPTNA